MSSLLTSVELAFFLTFFVLGLISPFFMFWRIRWLDPERWRTLGEPRFPKLGREAEKFLASLRPLRMQDKTAAMLWGAWLLSLLVIVIVLYRAVLRF